MRIRCAFVSTSMAAALILLLVVSAKSHAVDASSPLDKLWTFSFYFENDLLADTDQHYTSGLKLAWTSPEVSQFADARQLPDWTHRYIDRLPFIHRTGPEQQRNVVVSVGQNIYTPQDIDQSALIRDDRPYAGWLYLGLGFQNRDPTRLDELELQLGFVGPPSLAEGTQTFVHKFRGLDKPRGWDNQLKSEPAFALIYQRRWRHRWAQLWRRLDVDAITHAGGAAGTVHTYAEVGAMVRMGWNLPRDFGTSRIRPGGDTSAPIEGALLKNRPFGLHAFVGVDGQAVFRDIFLDGNTFADSHSVDKRRFVGNATLGASVVWGRLKLSIARVFRSKEFQDQKRSHRFGSITLSFTY